MLILAEGTIHHQVEGAEQIAAGAWLGPMVDAGVLHAGYHQDDTGRVLMILAAESLRDIDRRLLDLPVVRNGSVSFQTSRLTALRFD
jgi:hypothetical protein